MRTTKNLVIAFASLSLLGASACTKNPQEKKAENRAEAEKDVQDKKEDIAEIRTEAAQDNAKIDQKAEMQARDDFKKAADDRLGKVKDRLDELEGRVEKQADSVKTAATTGLAEAKGELEGIKVLLKDLDDEAKLPTWASVRTDVDAKLTSLEQKVGSLDSTMTAH